MLSYLHTEKVWKELSTVIISKEGAPQSLLMYYGNTCTLHNCHLLLQKVINGGKVASFTLSNISADTLILHFILKSLHLKCYYFCFPLVVNVHFDEFLHIYTPTKTPPK